MKIYCHAIFEKGLTEKLINELPNKYFLIERSTDNSINLANFLDAEIIFGNPPVEWFNQRNKKIVFWQLDSTGFDQYSNVSLDSETKVANMGAWFAQPCAETIVGGIMALYRGIDKLTLLKRETNWVGSPLRGELKILYNQNVVILGAGTIGSAVKNILHGMGCKIDILARTSPEANYRSKNELLDHLRIYDLVVNTLPGTALHFADEIFFENMKLGSVYASVGRGSTTDEKALIKNIKSGQLGGAVLDVTENEPLLKDNPLWELDHVILTQHTGGGHKDEHIGKVDLFLTNIFSLENGSNIIDEVSISKGY